MADNQRGDSVFTAKVTCSSSNQKVDMLTSRNTVSLIADGDCFINFDKAVTAESRYLLKANVPVDLHDLGGVRFLNYLASSSTPAIYVLATKSR
jgi:hypothetical protein